MHKNRRSRSILMISRKSSYFPGSKRTHTVCPTGEFPTHFRSTFVDDLSNKATMPCHYILHPASQPSIRHDKWLFNFICCGVRFVPCCVLIWSARCFLTVWYRLKIVWGTRHFGGVPWGLRAIPSPFWDPRKARVNAGNGLRPYNSVKRIRWQNVKQGEEAVLSGKNPGCFTVNYRKCCSSCCCWSVWRTVCGSATFQYLMWIIYIFSVCVSVIRNG